MRVEKKGKKEKEPILFVGSGPDTFGKKYHLVHGLNISIGKKLAENGIRVSDSTVSDHHCLVNSVGGEELWLIDQNSNYGVFKRIRKMEETVLNYDLDHIRSFLIGNETLLTISKSKSKPGEFVIQKNNSAGHDLYPIKSTPFCVGKDPKQDQIVIPHEEDDAISASHCLLFFNKTAGKWTIIDRGRKKLGSTNGVWIKLMPEVTEILSIGDSVRIGENSFLHFREEGFKVPQYQAEFDNQSVPTTEFSETTLDFDREAQSEF